MNAEIIAVGTELLLGQIANTNAQFLSKELAQLGINVYYHSVVGDNPLRLKQMIEIAKERSDLIIFTGGLGPTKDDLTKETVASVLSVPLVENKEVLEGISHYFQKQSRQMTDNNKKQALLLEGSTVLANEIGTAPGMALKKDDVFYMLLPGPPVEMEKMFQKYGRHFLKKQLENNEYIESRVLRFFGIGESQIETEIEDIIDSQTNPTIAPLIDDGEATLRLTAKDVSLKTAHHMLDSLENKILSRVGQYFYGYNHTSLSYEVFHLLKKKNLSISSAESLTGGAFAKEITNYAGSSSVYKGTIVCYDTEVKRTILKVPDRCIEQYGVVSGNCAKYMAENVRSILNTDIGISFTGVAGPSEQEDKPVGTVFIAITIAEHDTKIYPLKIVGSRNSIRTKTIKYGYFYLLKLLQSM